MTLQEIKDAVNAGKIVHWKSENYIVLRDKYHAYLIKCTNNQSCIGLTWKDGVTMNGNPEDFYISA